jgi:hypothetical protein
MKTIKASLSRSCRFAGAAAATAHLALAILAVGSIATSVRADTINACVNPSGVVKIVPTAIPCDESSAPLQWNQSGPAGPTGPAGASGVANVTYVTGGIAEGTSVARAFCPPGTKVTGGGGITGGVGLQQSFPISDATGVIAFGSTAIGWQVAAQDFGFAQAFVVCVGP